MYISDFSAIAHDGQEGATKLIMMAIELLKICNRIGINKLPVLRYNNDVIMPKMVAPMISACKIPNRILEIRIPPHIEVFFIMRWSNIPRKINSSAIGPISPMLITVITKKIGLSGNGIGSKKKSTSPGEMGIKAYNWSQNTLNENAMESTIIPTMDGSQLPEPFRKTTSRTAIPCLRK